MLLWCNGPLLANASFSIESKQIFPPASPRWWKESGPSALSSNCQPGGREHTSLSTPVAEDGGFSRQQAQIWSLRGPRCITLNRLVTPAQVHFLLSVSPSQSNEMSCKNLPIIYQFIQQGCFTLGGRRMNGENIYSLATKLPSIKHGCGIFRFYRYK